ncbi:MAG: TrkA family potassium uptake protein [Actinobacteria bacterium]|nr:TrkA family potassium uptake protein [Actinomycetota bacterium]
MVNLPVAVLGLGRFGEAVAVELSKLGAPVLGLDRRAPVVQRLAGRLSHVVVADTTDAEALAEVSLEDYACAVVAIGTDLESSILTTSLVAEMGINDIWAKALNREHARILERVGATNVVLPESEMGQRIAHQIRGRTLNFVKVADDWVEVITKPPKEMCSAPLDNDRLIRKYDVAVTAVKPEGAAHFEHVTSATRLGYSDRIAISGAPNAVDHFLRTR